MSSHFKNDYTSRYPRHRHPQHKQQLSRVWTHFSKVCTTPTIKFKSSDIHRYVWDTACTDLDTNIIALHQDPCSLKAPMAPL